MYGTMSSFVKLAYSRGFNAAELSFWQAFVAALLLSLCTILSREHKGRNMRRKDVLMLMCTGCAIGMTNYLYYKSVQFIPASLAIVLLMQFTWLSLLIDCLIFGRKSSKTEIATIAFLLVGTIMASGVMEISEWEFSVVGTILALGSSLTYAIYIVANGRICKDICWQAKSATIMTGSSLCIFLINAPVVFSCNYLGSEFACWIMLLAIIGTTIPTALFAAGISKIGAGLSSILMTIELPIAVLCAHFILGEHISVLRVAGVAVMLASICAMNYYKARH